MDWWKPRSRPACFMYSKAFWELKHWSFTHHPQGDSGLPFNQEHQGKRAKGWVNRSRSPPVWLDPCCILFLWPTHHETGLREWPGSTGTRERSGLCVGLVSWEWLWIFNCKVMVDWQHEWLTPGNSKGDLRFSRDMLERIEKTIPFHYWFYPLFLNATGQG